MSLNLMPQEPWEYAVCGGLLAFAGYLVVQIIREATKPPPVPPPPPKPKEKRGFTASDLAQYNGTQGKPVYLSCKGTVYEVSSVFYGPDGPYHAFAGKDATIPLGRMDASGGGANEAWEGVLSPDDQGVVDDWDAKFAMKYDVVGWFIPPWKENDNKSSD
eukprot:TRINITY_DN68489_c0_g1_i1.p2 TRINITY_DN68489_c0_g1~~TRINITY_DN68489_c0_g1_i1.p2  ORF type:complete len:160 (+),score=26.02 TRINITY_DN68489_c0_g1_i1:53-532(+)